MEELIDKAQKGNKAAFCHLLDIHLQILYKIAWTYLKNEEDIADAIQDTICSCYEKIGQLRRPEYFRTWLIRILINHCNDILSKRKQTVPVDMLPETGVQEKQYSEIEWRHVMKQLTEEYQTILILYYLEEMSVKEIAALLELKENTVKSRLLRGRRQLLQILEGKYEN
ncbi:MAG: sigma-70 family RNA polymerase sigma factor [Lachnospiraceae bacterium]|nr:sigma-70 family RNA polymerase sigma factor [Lachnospiraceae bacterium]MDD3795457.1 sigma-70 family RNA polymerase sigma factor [Lachnospiraceae bacterium]